VSDHLDLGIAVVVGAVAGVGYAAFPVALAMAADERAESAVKTDADASAEKR
jgi:hypothetical protein